MPEYAPINIANTPNPPLLAVPSPVDIAYAPRMTPRLRSGRFWVQDRQHYLYAKKASCHLHDLTWYQANLADTAEAGSERVWVRGIEITGTKHYQLNGRTLKLNGAALSHPGTLIEELNYDISLLDPLALGNVYNPDESVRITYDFPLWAAEVLAILDLVDPGAVIAGINLESTIHGAAGNSIRLVIAASGGAGTTATVTLTGTNEYTLAWFTSTTVATVVTALQGAGLPWTASNDGNGVPGVDLFSALLAAIPIAPPSTEAFAGGSNEGFTSSTQTEIIKIREMETLYELPLGVRNNAQVVMTDDSMQDWDRRDIAPEFTVASQEITPSGNKIPARIEFNAPFNHVANPDFEGDLEFWMTRGTPTIGTRNASFAPFDRARSCTKYAMIGAADRIAQMLPAFGREEQILSIAARGAVSTTVQASYTLYDENWNVLATGSQGLAMQGVDWQILNLTFGPAGAVRTYDAASNADAAWILIEILSSDDADIDYVFWGRGKLEPDHWNPKPLITVEAEVGDTPYYEHQPLIVYDQLGEPKANQVPLETCNTHAATNDLTDGFLYFHEYNDVRDFRLGLGGLNTSIAADLEAKVLAHWPELQAKVIIPNPSGGFYLGGTSAIGVSIVCRIMPDGTIDPDFNFSGNGTNGVTALALHGDTLYIGGDFTSVASTARARLAAFDVTTNSITAWDPGSTHQVNGIDVTPDGTTVFVAVSASGATVGGSTRDCFAGLSASTGLATAFNPNAAVTGGGGERIIWVDTNEIYCCGSATTGGGIDNLMKFDATGTIDAGFTPAVNGAVSSMRIVDDTLYIVGSFTSVFAATRNRFAVVDISTAAGSLGSLDLNLDGAVDELWVENGLILLTGNFTTAGGSPRTRLAMFNTAGNLNAWNPSLDAIGLTITVSDGVIGVGGSFSTVNSVAQVGSAFFKFYDGSIEFGRRHVPFAKMDGLGKLRHVHALRYNSNPWVREVTALSDIPAADVVEVLPAYGLVRTRLTRTLTSVAPLPVLEAGDREVTITGSGAVASVGDYVTFPAVSGAGVYQVIAISGDVLSLNRGLSVDIPSSAQVHVEYRVLRGVIGQQRVVRVRIRDTFGAPVGQHDITVSNDSPTVVNVAWDLPTNQDGETSFLIEFLTAGSAVLTFSGSGSAKLAVESVALPAANEIPSDPDVLSACSGYGTSVATW